MPSLVEGASRRDLARLLGASAALLALRPLAARAADLAAAPATPTAAGGRVRLNANENPYGPPPGALAAIDAALSEACRYPDEVAAALVADLAAALAVAPDQILLGSGSSQILHVVATAFTGNGRPAVVADPTFEALGHYAGVRGANVIRVPLTADFRHDLPAMASAAGERGLVYVCNPNNPTASLTPAGELAAWIDRLPPTVTVLVDEAYHHYADGDAGYASVVPRLAAHPNLVVARTFSKIYGMAGLRLGCAVASKATIDELRAWLPWDSCNLAALAAGRAALADPTHVATSRARNREVRAATVAALEKSGLRTIPSAANFVMVDLGRDVGPIVQALHGEGVDVGRRFLALPNHLRVTVGTDAEMRAFLAALERVTRRAAAA